LVLFAVRPELFEIDSIGCLEQTEKKDVKWNKEKNNPKHYRVIPKSLDNIRDIIENLMSELPGTLPLK